MDAIHDQVLAAATALATRASGWTFQIADVVKRLSHVNPGSVRTHVASRCCVNAPAHHQSRHPYFRAVGRGRYRLEPRYRRTRRKSTEPLPWPDNWFADQGTGVDATQIIENLKLTPTARLERMQQFAASLDDLRRHTSRG